MKKYLSLLLIVMILISTACRTKTTQNADNQNEKNDYESNSDIIIANDLFSISMKDEFKGLFNAEVNVHSIKIYDKENVEKGNPGLVIEIHAYQNPDDWATGPCEKVGEVTINQKIYDVILAYPTESQTGFDSLEMPPKYKSMYDARYDIAKTLKGVDGNVMEFNKGVKGDGMYDSILDEFKTAINEGWDSIKLENKNMSPMLNVMSATGLDVSNSLGYAYKDVNVDGIEELLIGDIESNTIYDIYTMVNRAPSHVVSGWDRNRYYYSGSMIVNEYSSGANESGIIVYNLLPNTTELFFQIGFKYDGYENEENPYFIANSKIGDEIEWENIDEAKYNEMEKRFTNYEKINYKQFSSYNK